MCKFQIFGSACLIGIVLSLVMGMSQNVATAHAQTLTSHSTSKWHYYSNTTQAAMPSNSAYWTLAQQTHNFVVGSILTPYNSYRIEPGSTTAYEWYNASQIYADAEMVRNGDARYNTYMNNTFAWMDNLWNHGSSVGGYFAAANVDGSGQGGGQYVDDNSLTGIVYLDCYDVTSGATKASYLTAAENIANWLMYSGQWDSTYGGGFWWSDSKQVKPTQSNGLAMQLFLRLYQITGRTYYGDWANSIKSWLDGQMYNSVEGLYIWQIESGGVKAYTYFTYDNAIMIEADLLYDQVMGDRSYLQKAEALANNLNAHLWDSSTKVYAINTADARVNPTWSGWASQSLIKLYQADGNPTWLNYAQENIDFMNAHLRNSSTYGYYQYCNLDGSNVDTTHIEGVDQEWMQRIQGMMADYR